jgi:hypothetical protein
MRLTYGKRRRRKQISLAGFHHSRKSERLQRRATRRSPCLSANRQIEPGGMNAQ